MTMTTPASRAVALNDQETKSIFFEYTFGVVPLHDGGFRFRLWAPGVAQVQLELQGRPPAPMKAVGAGFHELCCACEPGIRYRYGIGQGRSVPDPASRLQDGDVHDASMVPDPQSYTWEHHRWQGRPWTDAVLYEIHVGLAGGFNGVRARLAELAELGITAIELMPIADFPGPRNWGYDGVLPYAPDCAYGTPDELKALIDAAHGLGMMVFLDVVYNHFGPDGNYLSSYAADFFRDDVSTLWGAAIDFRRPQVRAFFAENALYWLREYRFDGLRLDAVHALSEPDWLPEMAGFVRTHLDPGRQVHLVLENDDNIASLMTQGFDAQWNDDLHHVLHHILTGETHGYYMAYQHDPTGMLARGLAEGWVYQGQPSPLRGGKPRGEPSAGLPPTAFVFFLQNHDQTGNRALGERLISLCAPDHKALQAAVALQLLTPHIPLLFMGEESGATAPFQYFTSFSDPALAQAVREGRRKEFADESANTGWQAENGSLPDPNDALTWKRSQQGWTGSGKHAALWRAYYRELLRVRRELIMPHLAGAHSVSVRILAPLCVAARWRLGNGSLLSIYCNLSRYELACSPEDLVPGEQLIFDSGRSLPGGVVAGPLPAASTIATLNADSIGAKAAP